jgi:hypothetical protein
VIQGKGYSAREHELDQRRSRSVLNTVRPCKICAKNGPFGFNDFKTAPHLAVFACRDHRADVEAALT